MDTDAIRLRLKSLGWSLLERPIRKNHPDPDKREVTQWNIVASKGERTFEVTGKTITEAMRNIGLSLGAINKDN